MIQLDDSATGTKTSVFYDGGCPVCRREIAFYKRRKGANRIEWVDLSRSIDGEVAPGLCRDAALARFHVLNADGKLVSGGEAFACLWDALPGLRPVGRVFRKKPLLWILNLAYDVFLKIRQRLKS